MVTRVHQFDATVGRVTTWQREGRVGQTLHPARHHHTPLTQRQLTRSEAHGLQTTGTDLVNCGAGGRAGQSRP